MKDYKQIIKLNKSVQLYGKKWTLIAKIHFPSEKPNSLQKRWNRLQFKQKIDANSKETTIIIDPINLDVKLEKVLFYILETHDYSTLKEILPILLLLTWKRTYNNTNNYALTECFLQLNNIFPKDQRYKHLVSKFLKRLTFRLKKSKTQVKEKKSNSLHLTNA
jgi:hypothetical protein